jgi:hypothetical protein
LPLIPVFGDASVLGPPEVGLSGALEALLEACNDGLVVLSLSHKFEKLISLFLKAGHELIVIISPHQIRLI